MSAHRDGSARGGTAGEWDVVDGQGFAGIRLGDDVDALRLRLGAHVTFRRTPDAEETDHVTDAGVLVTYGSDRTITFVEVVAPAAPRLAGVPLLGVSIDEVAAALAARGVRVEHDADGGTVVGRGVGLYAPDGIVEGVSIGGRTDRPG